LWLRRVFRSDLENFEDAALSDNPEIEEFRLLLRSRLGLKVPSDPGKLLYHALAVLPMSWCALSLAHGRLHLLAGTMVIDGFVKLLLIN